MNTAAWDIQDHTGQRFPGLPARFSVPAGQGVVEGNEIPYQPWALARKTENYKTRMTADPEAQCYLPGVPRITYMPHPFQIFQLSDRVVILYEYLHTTREIFTDGSRHPTMPVEFWMGDSRGRWEGNTLVVDVTLFTDRTWFDRAGNFHSDDLHVVERYTRTGRDHMLYEVTIEDPKVFTRPWKMRMPVYRRQEPTLSSSNTSATPTRGKRAMHMRSETRLGGRGNRRWRRDSAAAQCHSGAGRLSCRSGAVSPVCAGAGEDVSPASNTGRQTGPAGILAGTGIGHREHRRTPDD